MANLELLKRRKVMSIHFIVRYTYVPKYLENSNELWVYVGCLESSCNFVISLTIFNECARKLVCVNFHLFLNYSGKMNER